MSTLEEQITKLESDKAKELAKEKVRITRKYEVRGKLPQQVDHLFHLDYGHVEYNDTYHVKYVIRTHADLLEILLAFHAFDEFMPIGQYTTSCTSVTAYPHGEHIGMTPKIKALDAVMIHDSAGLEFGTAAIQFYPKLEGERLKVSIEFQFRHEPKDFKPFVYHKYHRNGHLDRNSIDKRPSAASEFASFRVAYGGGNEWMMQDSVGTYNNLIEYLMSEL